MIQENKELLLKDLCARLSYKIIVKVNDTQGIMDEIDIPNERIFVSNLNPFLYGGASWFTVNGDKIYPYLRPMSSMTEEEILELYKITYITWYSDSLYYKNEEFISFRDSIQNNSLCFKNSIWIFDINKVIDWLNSHYFDYRGLIEKGLAIEAPEGMYNV